MEPASSILALSSHKQITPDRQGDVIAEKPLLQLVTSWDRLRHLLLKAIDRQRYHFGYIFRSCRAGRYGCARSFCQWPGRKRGYYARAVTVTAPAYVTQLAPQVQPSYAGYYIWRGAPDEGELSLETRRTIFPYYTFFIDRQLQVLGYPISGADNYVRPGHRRYNFGWYRVADEPKTSREMCTDDNGESTMNFRCRAPLSGRTRYGQI